ncbi:MAG: hypothetical protein KCHDKBKB_00666 [Elusimicrobia bacterium]|nr:hypothetical protein [Elusimicrobiota bacterium]
MTTRDQMTKDFDEFVGAMRDILLAKNHDYTGSQDDPLWNFRKSENFGVPAWRGALVRFSDKVSRLETFARKELFEVKDESFEDTLRDACNYLFLVRELYKEYKLLKKPAQK